MPLKHLKVDLIDNHVKILLDDPKYAAESEVQHRIADSIAAAVDGMDAMHYRAVVQGLFEGGFLTTDDRDFNCEQLFQHIYGVKVFNALDAFSLLHAKLRAMGMIDHSQYETKYNTSGDNYYSAYTFHIYPTNDNYKVCRISDKVLKRKERKTPDDFNWPEAKRRVVIVENQSPMWAYILEDDVFTGKATKFHIVQLRENYNDDANFTELIEAEFNFKSLNISAFNDTVTRHILTTLNIEDQECEPVLEPKRIEYALFNIYSGRDSLGEKEEK